MNFALSILRGLGAYLTASTRYTALGATSGALVALASPWMNISLEFGFLLGACLPLAPVYFYLTHPTVMAKRLATLQQWQKAGLITTAEYRELKRQSLQWYSKRLFGRDGEGVPNPPETSTSPPPPSQSPPQSPALG